MPDHLGNDMRKVKDDKEEPEKEIKCKFYEWLLPLTYMFYIVKIIAYFIF